LFHFSCSEPTPRNPDDRCRAKTLGIQTIQVVGAPRGHPGFTLAKVLNPIQFTALAKFYPLVNPATYQWNLMNE
jgi:hypothetical protein